MKNRKRKKHSQKKEEQQQYALVSTSHPLPSFVPSLQIPAYTVPETIVKQFIYLEKPEKVQIREGYKRRARLPMTVFNNQLSLCIEGLKNVVQIFPEKTDTNFTKISYIRKYEITDSRNPA